MKNVLSCLTSEPSICQNVICLAKNTFLNVRPRLSYLDIFELELEKAVYISTLKFFQTQKFTQK